MVRKLTPRRGINPPIPDKLHHGGTYADYIEDTYIERDNYMNLGVRYSAGVVIELEDPVIEPEHPVNEVNPVESESDTESDEYVANSEDGFDSLVESDEEVEQCSLVFDPKDVHNPVFRLEMVFENKQLFCQVVNSHAIMTKRNLKVTKNDLRRVYAKCLERGCDWHINAIRVTNEGAYKIREYDPYHSCCITSNVKCLKSKWLAQKYEDQFRTDSKRRVKGWKADVEKSLGVDMSKYQAYRAKRTALQNIHGEADKQFSMLWDYAQAIRDKNPGSTVIMQLEDNPDPNGQRKFDKLDICFEALKKGWMAGCRPFIGVDGCHLKGPHKGVLLCAVGVDPCDNPFPIAWAIVGSETKVAWEWFLTLLKEDLDIQREDCYTFMSDKQKGLVPAFEKVLPGANNRFCLRHLHANMKLAGFRGLNYKLALWRAAEASTIAEYKLRMDEIAKLDGECLDWFQDKPPIQWSRSHFDHFSKCDMLLNNICETFNALILEAREKPVLTMLEWIRIYVMKRMQENRDECERKWGGKLVCPKIMKIVERIKKKINDFIPTKSNDWLWELDGYDGSKHSVNLKAATCTCRSWQLSGIPCTHALCAIIKGGNDPEWYVNRLYHVDTYKTIYANAMIPMAGPQLWEKTDFIPPLPPNFGRKKGRPVRARRVEFDEQPLKRKKGARRQTVQKIRKQKWTVTCKFCEGKGHNIKGCEWKKFADEMVANIDAPQPTQETQHIQQEEMVVDESASSTQMTRKKKSMSAAELQRRQTNMQGKKKAGFF